MFTLLTHTLSTITDQCPSKQIIGVPDRSSVKIGENPSSVVKMQLMHAIRSSPIHGSRQVSIVLIYFCFLFHKIHTDRLLVVDFCDNEELSCEYHLSLDADETTSLLSFYGSNMQQLTPILSQNQDDDEDSEVAILSSRSMSNEGRVSLRSSITKKALLLFQAGVSILTNNTSTSGFNLDTSESDTETTLSTRIDGTRTIAALSSIRGSMVNEVEYNAGAVMKRGRKRTHMDPVSDGSDKSNKSPRLEQVGT